MCHGQLLRKREQEGGKGKLPAGNNITISEHANKSFFLSFSPSFPLHLAIGKRRKRERMVALLTAKVASSNSNPSLPFFSHSLFWHNNNSPPTSFSSFSFLLPSPLSSHCPTFLCFPPPALWLPFFPYACLSSSSTGVRV